MSSSQPPLDVPQACALVAASLSEFLADTRRQPPPHGLGPDTIVFGPGGVLDSLGLVGFIADVECRVAERSGAEIVLADERAMSRSRSPFRTVASLAELVVERVAESRGGAESPSP